MLNLCRILVAITFIAFLTPFASFAQSMSDKPFVVEYYYKTKW